MYRGVGHVSGECFTSLNFVCFRSQYVGAVNSKLFAELRVSALRVFAIAVLTTYPFPFHPPYSIVQSARPSFRLTEVRGKALPDINFVNNELPARRREKLYTLSFLSRGPSSSSSFSPSRGAVCRYNLREHISRASRGNFSTARRKTRRHLQNNYDSSLLSSGIVRPGASERRVEL